MKDISGGEEVDGKVRHLVSYLTIWFNPMVKEKGTALIVIDEGRVEVLHTIEIRRHYLELRVKAMSRPVIEIQGFRELQEK
jgi:hypothetical protein